MIRATQGAEIKGLKIVHRICDDFRYITFYLAENGDMTIGFCGTLSSVKDVFLDILAFRIPFHGFRAHAGAVMEVKSLLPEIMDQIRIHTPKAVYLAGHSQGGAHAVLAGIVLREIVPVEATTFGALPAVNENVSFPVINYILRNDPMAWVPWWIIGLRWAGKTVKLGPMGWPRVSGHMPSSYAKEMKA